MRERPRPFARSRPGSSSIQTLIVALFVTATLAGCSGASGRGGSLRSESLGTQPVVLDADFQTVVYSHDPEGDTSFFLSDIPLEDLVATYPSDGQVMHIELLWNPKPGLTPMDSSATNVSIRHVIISGGEVGVYGGAGFALPHGGLGGRKLSVTISDATMRLVESTGGFTDPLTPARITGGFTASLDPLLSRKLHRALSQLVTNAIGRPRHVREDARTMTARAD